MLSSANKMVDSIVNTGIEMGIWQILLDAYFISFSDKFMKDDSIYGKGLDKIVYQ